MPVMACAKKLKIKMSKAKAKKAKLHRMNPCQRKQRGGECGLARKGREIAAVFNEESSALLASMQKQTSLDCTPTAA